MWTPTPTHNPAFVCLLLDEHFTIVAREKIDRTHHTCVVGMHEICVTPFNDDAFGIIVVNITPYPGTCAIALKTDPCKSYVIESCVPNIDCTPTKGSKRGYIPMKMAEPYLNCG